MESRARILDLSLDDLRVDLGDGVDRLQAYVEDVIADLSKNRLAVHKKTERKNGLSYTERWVLLSIDAEIPGESSTGSPEAAGIHG
ncbi:hypothetical protein [Natronococcus wangiae]|uniref:hypothetical protein n=1 Tax=Natronococcus wangiae TaxID=3068275 RepID=UPI00273D4DB5|nr:hypothetical protein [Natronococcus sp. AD5]